MNNIHNKLITLLKYKFGFNSFKPGQEEIINKLLMNHNVLAILPTGAGKTLVYQMYALVQNLPIIIVSPLLSLMQDQVNRLQYLGFKRSIAINSLLDWSKRKFVLNHLQDYQFIYISPEMLSQDYIFEKIKNINLGLMVIDEAHCISQWGPDFRPEYLNLGNILIKLNNPLTLMLTATASSTVRHDILKKLNFNSFDVSEVIRSIDRPNIFLSVHHFDDLSTKNTYLMKLVKELKMPGIIYFSSRKQANQVASILRDECYIKAEAYHSSLNLESRYKIQHQFMDDKIDIICATSAFGMGIDKNNIRFVIHYHMPTSLEEYMQEIGRAGRDGKQSIAILLHHRSDEQLAYHLSIDAIPSSKLIKSFYNRPQYFNKINKDWVNVLNYYYYHNFTLNQTISIFNQLIIRKSDSLNKMMNYIYNDKCKRKYLLSVFDEYNTHHTYYCCDYSKNTTLKELNLYQKNKFDNNNLQFNWKQSIKKLFNINNDYYEQ